MRAADLRVIDSSSTLYQKFSSSGQNITIANVPFDSLPASSDAAESLARRCAAEYHEYAMERGAEELGSAKKLVLHVIMSPLTGFGRWRKELMREHSEFVQSQLRSVVPLIFTSLRVVASLSNLLEAVEELSLNHAILYSSSPLPHHSRRQSDSSSPKQTLPEPFAFAAATPSATGIFARYQLLTPGLITALLAVFFVIVPLVVLAIQALASIESSVRLEAPKIVSQERKSQ